MMITFTCLSPLVGAVLGQRYTFLILIPAIACTLAAAAGFGIAAGLNFWSTMLAMVLTVTGLEIGYVAGAAIRLIAARGERPPSTSIAKTLLRPILSKNRALIECRPAKSSGSG